MCALKTLTDSTPRQAVAYTERQAGRSAAFTRGIYDGAHIVAPAAVNERDRLAKRPDTPTDSICVSGHEGQHSMRSTRTCGNVSR